MTLDRTSLSRAARRRLNLRAAMLGVAAMMLPGIALAQTPAPEARQGDGGVSAFYTWDKPIPATPGKLLRREPLPAHLGVPGAGEQFRILYSSTDGVEGKGPVAVSGAVYLPKGKAPKGGWPLMVWAHGTTGMADVSAPSWHGQFDVYQTYLKAWLDAGYAIVASDYQGLGVPGPHPYLNTRPAAYSSLDSARVVLKTVPGISNRIITVGHSQGAAAAFATGGYAAAYAPDLHYLGTVATGVPYAAGKTTSSTEQYDQDKVDPTISYMLLMMLMVQQTHPDLKASDILTERAQPLLEKIGTLSGDDLYTQVMGAGLTWANTFKPGALPRLIGMTMQRMEYPTLKLTQPVFIGIGADDTIALPQGQQLLVTDACEAGTVVEAHLYAKAAHDGVLPASLADSLTFAKNLLAGKAVTPVCKPQIQ